MNHKEIFYRESKKYQFPKTNIAQEISEPLFVEINRLFSSADGLSIKNGEKHRRVLLALSIVGTLLTFSFLIYDEIEIYGLILACGIMIVCLFVIRHFSVKLDCHRKYLQYRVLAETLRLQYYLSMAAIRMKVSDLLPWSIQMEIEWIKEVLETLPMAETKEKQSVLECWIKDQKSYHQQALKKAEKNNKRDKVIGKSVLFITILAYLIAIVFEFFVYKNNPSSMNINSVRVILKVVLGTM